MSNETNINYRPSTTVAGDMFAPELFQTDTVMDTPSIFEQQGMVPLEQSSSPEFMRKDSVTTEAFNGMDTIMEEDDGSPDEPKKKERSTKQRDPEKLKDSKHSSKNEGQHTDRRYLCYVCLKLFTRRRSVRDHINKIHGEKTWEPTRSLEVVVEPHTGEPIEPLEDIIARGPPPPPPKTPKGSKSEKEDELSKKESQEDGVQPEEQEDKATAQTQTSNQKNEATPEVDSVLASKAEQKSDPEPEESTADLEPEATVVVSAPAKMKKEESQRSDSRPASIEPTAPIPAPVIGKKRPLAATKKGTAKIKSSTPSKRLKLTDSERSTPARSPSVAPTQKPGSKLKKPVNINVPSPSSRTSSRQASPSPSPSVATPASSNDDGEIFCICRKGDNHTWMIACDGPCEEWFHGKCVGIKERDGELIDKYICPNCSRDGFITTWKRMCRRQDCRKPARVLDNPPSKYCSLDCGRLFFVDLLKRGDPDAQVSKDGQFIIEQVKQKKMRKKVRKERTGHANASGVGTPALGGSRPHTPAYSEDERSEYETDSSLDDEELPNRGGPLRAGEVKALLQQCKTIESWRELGKKPETPPRELDEKDAAKLQYDEYENTRLASISKELAELDEKLKILAAREKMFELIKARSSSIIDDVKKTNPKLKMGCGYDPRVAWCDEEFLQWYQSEGKQILESGKIGPPGDGDTAMTNGVDESDEEEKNTTTKGGVCIRNNCPRHGRTWQKGQLAEVRFEQDLIKKRQDILAVQEHDIRSRGQIRALEMQKAPVA